jgi:hypothetical protein
MNALCRPARTQNKDTFTKIVTAFLPHIDKISSSVVPQPVSGLDRLYCAPPSAPSGRHCFWFLNI